ncbi:hypothetical protein KP509_24G051900 [Ceratopteris richardii]|uniref:Uncharacterized protein n=1 Tax=Ceratopteris richardii TaxID=49495 RepID=A0A8T2RXC7_CERRI|nr:hypothetical protein KP509_24G051900 [Ceratopteris richardii]
METNSKLIEDWEEVEAAVKRYVEKKRAMAKFMQDWQDLQEEQIQVNQPIGKEVVPSNTMEEMFKRFSDLMIQSVKQMMEFQSPQATNNRAPKALETKRCIWCDSLEHNRYSCEIFKEALAKNQVFIKEKMIYESKTGEKVNINSGRGGMKVFFPGTSGNVDSTSHTSTYLASNEIRGVIGWNDHVDTSQLLLIYAL